jgi:hypothetical protein
MSQGQQGLQAFSFPVLKPKDLVESMQSLVVPPLTMDDLRAPSPMVVERVYRQFVMLLMGVTDQELGITLPKAAKDFEYPQLHELSVPSVNLMRYL